MICPVSLMFDMRVAIEELGVSGGLHSGSGSRNWGLHKIQTSVGFKIRPPPMLKISIYRLPRIEILTIGTREVLRCKIG